jgi:hypothetical protein
LFSSKERDQEVVERKRRQGESLCSRELKELGDIGAPTIECAESLGTARLLTTPVLPFNLSIITPVLAN